MIVREKIKLPPFQQNSLGYNSDDFVNLILKKKPDDYIWF